MRKQRRLLQVEELESRIVPSAAVYDGLTIPTNHARLMFTPALLSQARQYFASHPFTPSSSDPYGNALRYQMTGETAYAQNAITSLMNFTISDKQGLTVKLNEVGASLDAEEVQVVAGRDETCQDFACFLGLARAGPFRQNQRDVAEFGGENTHDGGGKGICS